MVPAPDLVFVVMLAMVSVMGFVSFWRPWGRVATLVMGSTTIALSTAIVVLTPWLRESSLVDTTQGVILVASLLALAACIGGSSFVEFVLAVALWKDRDFVTKHLPGSAAIGVMERGSFFLAALLGFPEVAAVIVAVKALAVYRKKEADVSGRRVLGTLTSFLWTLVILAIGRVLGLDLAELSV